MQRTEKETVVAELTEQLRAAESLIVADYRGLTNAQLDDLRGKLRDHGAKFQIVKNTLTRRAAEAAGTDTLLALLEGPTALAFVETDGDPIAVAKALAQAATETKVLTLRGGVMSGRVMTEADVEMLAKLPPADVVKSQLVGVIVAPLTQLLGLLEAPVRDLVGLIDARIEQLGGDSSVDADVPEVEAGADPVDAVADEQVVEEPAPEVEATEDTDETGASADAEAPE